MKKNTLAFAVFLSTAIILPEGIVSAWYLQGFNTVRQIAALIRTHRETKREYTYINGRRVLSSVLSVTTRYYANGGKCNSVSQYTRYDPYTRRVVEYEYRYISYRSNGSKITAYSYRAFYNSQTGRLAKSITRNFIYNNRGRIVIEYYNERDYVSGSRI